MDETLSGGCLCGAVRFQVTEPPVAAGYCHCTRCQRRTGTAASAQARLAPGSLTIERGSDAIREWVPGTGNPKAYCGSCGAHLWSRSPTDPDVVNVRMGAFDADPGVRPSFRQYVAYAAVWEPIPDDGLERFQEARG